MGFTDIRYDAMGNLIATYGTGTSGKSLMFIGNAMNQPASTMPNPYDGDVVDGAKYDLPGECVMGKGASEQKAQPRRHAARDGDRDRRRSADRRPARLHLLPVGRDRQARRHQERGRRRRRARRHGGAGRHRPQDHARQPRPHRRVRDRQGLALPFVAAVGRRQRRHRRDRGHPAAAEQGEGRQEPSAARQAVADRQPHPQLPGLDPHRAGALRAHARPPAAARRRSERGLRRDRAGRQGGRAAQRPGQRQALRRGGAARAVHVPVAGDDRVTGRARAASAAAR